MKSPSKSEKAKTKQAKEDHGSEALIESLKDNAAASQKGILTDSSGSANKVPPPPTSLSLAKDKLISTTKHPQRPKAVPIVPPKASKKSDQFPLSQGDLSLNSSTNLQTSKSALIRVSEIEVATAAELPAETKNKKKVATQKKTLATVHEAEEKVAPAVANQQGRKPATMARIRRRKNQAPYRIKQR